ncbi:hypothetical protein KSP39_PZI007771 [Platanthera zijinensis]|uniref:Uncharacterized protein n=1 Tax=Platanthera zijinensis TaxID=2320716 RepID=A0AAP0BNY6_9ASPA
MHFIKNLYFENALCQMCDFFGIFYTGEVNHQLLIWFFTLSCRSQRHQQSFRLGHRLERLAAAVSFCYAAEQGNLLPLCGVEDLYISFSPELQPLQIWLEDISFRCVADDTAAPAALCLPRRPPSFLETVELTKSDPETGFMENGGDDIYTMVNLHMEIPFPSISMVELFYRDTFYA